MELFWALVFFAFATSITPGPNNIMIMSSGLNYGVQKSLVHLAGIQLAKGAWAYICKAAYPPRSLPTPDCRALHRFRRVFRSV